MSPKKSIMDLLHPGKIYHVSQGINVWRFLSDEDCRKHFINDIDNPGWVIAGDVAAWKLEVGRIYTVSFGTRIVYIGLVDGTFKNMYKFLHGERIIYVTERSCQASKMYRIW